MKLKICYSPRLAFSPAFKFVLEGHLFLVKSKFSHPVMLFDNDTEVEYVIDEEADNKVIYAMLFTFDKYGRCFNKFAYIDEAYKGNRISVMAFEDLERTLSKRGYPMVPLYTDMIDENNLVKHLVLKLNNQDAVGQKLCRFIDHG